MNPFKILSLANSLANFSKSVIKDQREP